MEKLDRLGWAAGVSFRAYGVRVGIRSNQPAALVEAEACFPPGWKPAASPVVDLLCSVRLGGAGRHGGVRHFHLLYDGAAQVARTLDREMLFSRLESHLHLAIAALSDRRVFVHAGVVGWQGRAILLPGRTFTGKSTLVAALLRAGATYYSDEYAVLDEKGLVHPFPRRLSLRGEPGAPERRVEAGDLGSRVGRGPLPVGAVVLSRYREGSAWRPRRLSAGRAVLDLLNNAVPARRRPAAVLEALGKAVGGAVVLKGSRGEAPKVAEALLSLPELR